MDHAVASREVRGARRGTRRAWLRLGAGPFCTVSGVFVAGVLFWGAFNWSLELTNTEEFCISCHEMQDNVYQEYRHTVHFRNRTGVRATCPDCHVPREWAYKVVRKIRASNELYHHFRGSIDTREKFVSTRLDLARNVWRAMQETDSRECRNCHAYDFMDARSQRTEAADRHRRGVAEGKTCIDCHKGIAHKLPEEYLDAVHEGYLKDKVPCEDCHVDLEKVPKDEDWDWDKEEDWSTTE